MADVRTVAEAQTAPPLPVHSAIRREDYRPPDWLVPEIRLDFDLDADRTRVRAVLEVVRNGEHDRPLRLDGDELKLLSISPANARPSKPRSRSAPSSTPS
jgi:aminopeptidase N